MTLPVPPDAGASYLGAYTLRNDWVIWLLKNDPHLLTVSPAALHRTDVGEPPRCAARAEEYTGKRWRFARPKRECDQAMKYRPGAWCCYHHREPVRVRFFLKLPKMRLCDDKGQPIDDVLALIGKDVDIEYRDGRWRVVEGKP